MVFKSLPNGLSLETLILLKYTTKIYREVNGVIRPSIKYNLNKAITVYYKKGPKKIRSRGGSSAGRYRFSPHLRLVRLGEP